MRNLPSSCSTVDWNEIPVFLMAEWNEISVNMIEDLLEFSIWDLLLFYSLCLIWIWPQYIRDQRRKSVQDNLIGIYITWMQNIFGSSTEPEGFSLWTISGRSNSEWQYQCANPASNPKKLTNLWCQLIRALTPFGSPCPCLLMQGSLKGLAISSGIYNVARLVLKCKGSP